MKSRILRSILYILVAGSILALLLFYVKPRFFTDKERNAEPAWRLQDAFVEVAEKALPAVVVVKTSFISRRKSSASSNPYDKLLRRWFGVRDRPQSFVPCQQGSGFFVTKDGHIVTNYHIVRGQKDFVVTLRDGKEYDASIVGIDPKVDLAVLKIEAGKDVPYLKFADSKDLKVGHWAIAVGAPYALDYTVTAGIVSHKGRDVGLNVYENYIQTDAAINPGNSGGPLLNLKGEVIGVNDFIMTSSPEARGNIGLSFSISSDLAKLVVSQLIKTGKVSRAWLGVATRTLSKDSAIEAGLEGGVVVIGIYPGDPAERSGITHGDIIVSINDKSIKNSRDLRDAILKFNPGEKLNVTVRRSGEDKVFEVVAGRQSHLEMDGESVTPLK